MIKINLRYGALSEAERAEFPTITVAGVPYIVPPLAARQNRRIIPRMSRLGMIDFNNLTEEKIDDLYLIIYWALTRAYEISEAEFMDMAIPLSDLMPAIAVITEQTGMAALRPPGAPSSGEAQATEKKPIGTSSSPEPALQPDGDGITSRTLTSDVS